MNLNIKHLRFENYVEIQNLRFQNSNQLVGTPSYTLRNMDLKDVVLSFPSCILPEVVEQTLKMGRGYTGNV